MNYQLLKLLNQHGKNFLDCLYCDAKLDTYRVIRSSENFFLALDGAYSSAVEQIVQEKGLTQMSNEDELVAFVREIIAQNPEQAEQFREGKEKVLGFFVGQLMKKTKGTANPQLANELFRKELTS